MWSHPPLQDSTVYKSTFDVKRCIPAQPSLTMRVSNDIGSKQISVRSVQHSAIAAAAKAAAAAATPAAASAPALTPGTGTAATSTNSASGTNSFTFRSYGASGSKAPSNRVQAMATSASSSMLGGANGGGGGSDAAAAGGKPKSVAAQVHAAMHAELTKTHFELEHPVWKKTNVFVLPREHAIGASDRRGGVSNANRRDAMDRAVVAPRAGRSLPRTVDRQQHHQLWEGGVASTGKRSPLPAAAADKEETKTAAPAPAPAAPAAAASNAGIRLNGVNDPASIPASHFTSMNRASYVPPPHAALVDRTTPVLTSLQEAEHSTAIGRTKLMKVKLAGNDLWRTQYSFGRAPPQFTSVATSSFQSPADTQSKLTAAAAAHNNSLRRPLPSGAAGARSNSFSSHNPITGAERQTAVAGGPELQRSPFEYSHRAHYGKLTRDGGLQRKLGLPLPASGVSLYWYDSPAQAAVDKHRQQQQQRTVTTAPSALPPVASAPPAAVSTPAVAAS